MGILHVQPGDGSHLEQVFITQYVAQSTISGHVLSVAENDESLDCGQFLLQLDHEINERQVQYDILILSMVHNVVKLTLKQPASGWSNSVIFDKAVSQLRMLLWQASCDGFEPGIESVHNSPQTHDAIPAEKVLLFSHWGFYARERIQSMA